MDNNNNIQEIDVVNNIIADNFLGVKGPAKLFDRFRGALDGNVHGPMGEGEVSCPYGTWWYQKQGRRSRFISKSVASALCQPVYSWRNGLDRPARFSLIFRAMISPVLPGFCRVSLPAAIRQIHRAFLYLL